MEAYKQDILRLAKQGKLTLAEQVAYKQQFVATRKMPHKLWANSARMVLFVLNRLRDDKSFPRMLPPDNLQDVTQDGLLAAHEAIRTWEPGKSNLANWLIPAVAQAMRKAAWRSVKAGINTKEAIKVDSLYEQQETVTDDVNDDSWLAEPSYNDPPSGMLVPDGEPVGAEESQAAVDDLTRYHNKDFKARLQGDGYRRTKAVKHLKDGLLRSED